MQLELAEHLIAKGHQVEKFSWEDAFPDGAARLLPGWLGGFARRAESFVRQNAESFDVVDAHQGTILHTGADLGLRGALIVRSIGLVHFYREWERKNGLRTYGVRGVLGWRRHRLVSLLNERATERSFDAADCVLANNTAEAAFISQRAEWASKVEVVPSAMSTATWDLLSKVPVPTSPSGEGTVVFVGAWGPRKGSRDWGSIVSEVWRSMPATRFIFAVGFPENIVRTDLGVSSDPRVEVLERFTPGDIPALLSRASVGGFPSYIEGSPFAVLEKLAAALPVVAYDVPGAHDLLAPLGSDLLVAPGDVDAFAGRLVDLLTEETESRRSLAQACRDAASAYTLESIGRRTLDLYQSAREGAA